MLTLLDKLTSYIAPHECLACGLEGTPLCAPCQRLLPDIIPQCCYCRRTDAAYKICKACRKRSSLQNVWIRTPYEGFAEQLVRDLKFNRVFQAADVIATVLSEQFGGQLPHNTVLVPVPTATSRVRQRGYDQAVLIARALSKKTNLPCSNLLARYGQYRQTGSSRTQRITQLEKAFQIRKDQVKDTQEVILVDDVLTTGATLESAAKTLKHAGIEKIGAIVFARAE